MECTGRTMLPCRVAALLALVTLASGRMLQDSCSAVYGQCGGVNWSGPTCCVAGSTCEAQANNKYYSQCLPSGTSSGTPPADSPEMEAFNTVSSMLSQAEIEAILGAFDTWNAALHTLDTATVADLYTPDAILVPTLSRDIRTTRAEIMDYFKLFLAKKPDGKLNEYNIREDGVDSDGNPNLVINSGIYTFDFADGSSATARYTFVYKLLDGKWMIHEHHSSMLPSLLVQKPAEGPAVYKNSADPKMTEEEVKGVLAAFDKWNAALALDPKAVVALYKRNAVLVPTVADDIATTQAEREHYFEKFLINKPIGELNEYNIRLESVDELGLPLEVSNSGIYTFKFAVTGDVVVARYSFVYERIDTQWIITQHHSSKLPEV